ncbi:MAG: phosphoribosylformylglycinamidine synthase subunit PurS [Actinomycetota bacterium]|nr:phosphoribosylformylglycinamidine synthase subunit PurS [Actinomycetota bacterium]
MASFELLVEVRRREGIADPEGATVQRALPALGFDTVGRVRMGRAIRVEVEAPDEAAARAVGVSLANRLLANPVMEDSEILACRALPGAADAAPGAGEPR